MSGIGIRPARTGDAAVIATMMNRLNAHEGLDATLFTEAKVLDHAFGPSPAYTVLLAEVDGAIVGYASFESFFDTDLCERGAWMIDVYVVESARRRGVGRALVAAIARWAVDNRRSSLCWGVMPRNRPAVAFYESLGAEEDPGRVMGVKGDLLRALAAPADEAAKQGPAG